MYVSDIGTRWQLEQKFCFFSPLHPQNFHSNCYLTPTSVTFLNIYIYIYTRTRTRTHTHKYIYIV